MVVWSYDKTFEGLLTLVFDCYQRQVLPGKILGNGNAQRSLFRPDYEVLTDEAKGKRVWSGLRRKVSGGSCQMLYCAYLSEVEDIELVILRFIRKAFEASVSIELNFGDRDVLELLKLAKKVIREAERVRMFVRFQKAKDNIYYASFEPKYNVLPLAIRHFEERFADQQWAIYDTKRSYGFFYNLKTTEEFRFVESCIDPATGQVDKSVMDADELLLQAMWKCYFKSMCIRERVNPRLHVQLLPKRFWKYLVEKQV